jgi:hypothetical protein
MGPLAITLERRGSDYGIQLKEHYIDGFIGHDTTIFFMEEEEDWLTALEDFDKKFKFISRYTLIADSVDEVLREVSAYLNSPERMRRRKLAFINWSASEEASFEGMKLCPTKEGKWLATLSFEDQIG